MIITKKLRSAMKIKKKKNKKHSNCFILINLITNPVEQLNKSFNYSKVYHHKRCWFLFSIFFFFACLFTHALNVSLNETRLWCNFWFLFHLNLELEWYEVYYNLKIHWTTAPNYYQHFKNSIISIENNFGCNSRKNTIHGHDADFFVSDKQR